MAGSPSSFRKVLVEARFWRLLRFVAVGGTTFAVYFALQFVLDWAGLAPLLALTIAYAVAIAYHFLMNRHFTFRSTGVDGGVWVTLSRYASVVLLNYLITVIVVMAGMSAGFRVQSGMFAAIPLTTIFTYLLSKAWIFQSVGEAGSTPPRNQAN